MEDKQVIEARLIEHEEWFRTKKTGRRLEMEKADLTKIKLKNSFFRRANLTEATLFQADFERADFRAAILVSANLSGAVFHKASMQGVNLRGACALATDFTAADLTEADLSYADFRGADLTGADLSEANLRGIDLRNTVLTDVTFPKTKLEGMKMLGAEHNAPGMINILTPEKRVYISKTHTTIGCKTFTNEQWRHFSEEVLSAMSRDAREWYHRYNDLVLLAASIVEEMPEARNKKV